MQVILESVRRVARCPLCGSTNLHVDVQHGVLVCRNCGYVVDDTIFDYTTTPHIDDGARNLKRFVSSKGSSHGLRLLSARREARLSGVVGASSPLFQEFSEKRTGDIARIVKANKCIKRLAMRLPEREAAALLHAAYIIENDEYPLPSELAAVYGITKSRAKTLVRKALECLGKSAKAVTL